MAFVVPDLPSHDNQVAAIAISNLVAAIAAMFLADGTEPAARFLAHYEALNKGMLGDGPFADVINTTVANLQEMLAEAPGGRHER